MVLVSQIAWPLLLLQLLEKFYFAISHAKIVNICIRMALVSQIVWLLLSLQLLEKFYFAINHAKIMNIFIGITPAFQPAQLLWYLPALRTDLFVISLVRIMNIYPGMILVYQLALFHSSHQMLEMEFFSVKNLAYPMSFSIRTAPAYQLALHHTHNPLHLMFSYVSSLVLPALSFYLQMALV